MAEKLIEQWRLAVLRVGLDLSARSPAVTSRLDAFPDGRRRTYWTRRDEPQAFGLPDTTDPPSHLSVPEDLAEAVTETMVGQLGRESALWLRLEPPYGYLGAVPWEDLIDRIDVPVLRVPDRLPVPITLGSTWSIAVVVSAPRDSRWGADHVNTFVDQLQAQVAMPVEVDVFADAGTYRMLRPDLDPAPPHVRIHAPSDARGAHLRRSERLPLGRRRTEDIPAIIDPDDARLVWLDWIVEGLEGKAVRAVHLAAEGCFDRDRPMLTIAADPSGAVPDRRGADDDPSDADDDSCSLVSAEEVWRLADTLGAPLVSLGSPTAGLSDVSVRMMADTLGQQRPGPTLYTSLPRDTDSSVLAQAHAFLAGPSSGRQVPRSSCLFAYVQPESVRPVLADSLTPQHTGQEQKVVSRPRTKDLGLDDLPAPDDSMEAVSQSYGAAAEVPVWVASSSRFLETQQAGLDTALSVPGEGKRTKHAYDTGTEEALAEIQDLLQRHARGS